MNNILVLGCGGRENAMVKALLKNPNISIFCYAAYKQPFIYNSCKHYQTFKNGVFSIDECIVFCTQQKISYAIIGSEAFLQQGIVDKLEGIGIKCIGPTKDFATIETSKIFARNLMCITNLDTYNPDFQIVSSFTEFISIIRFLNKYNNNVVIKPNGLHGGKGVKVYGDHLFSRDDIIDYIVEVLESNEDLLIEEKLEGEEFSLITITDGTSYVHCPLVQDFKRLQNGNRGPNTGSMGCISYEFSSFIIDEDTHKESKRINEVIIQGLNTRFKNDTNCYKGFLYGSFMKTNQGKLKVIEFNARLGDPEGIPLLETMETDFFDVCYHITNKTLEELDVTFKNVSSICTYLVPVGYPNNPQKNFPIQLNTITTDELDNIHFASVETDNSGNLTGKGSRSLAIYCEEKILCDANATSKNILKKIIEQNPNCFQYRDDLYSIFLLRKSQIQCEQEYLTAGVNVEEGNKVVYDITPYIQSTYNDNVLNSIGSFGGCYHLKDIIKQYIDPVLVSSIDGVGTKSIISIDHLKQRGFYNLGIDIVNHCVNDVLVQGATPLYFLDYFASSHIKSCEVVEFVKGICDTCNQCNCVVMGGETAEMPNIYTHGKHDFVGCMIGVVEKHKILDGKKTIRSGDILVGIPSSGLHTNGYSLVRKLMKEQPNSFNTELLDALCVPHKSYLSDIQLLRQNDIDIRGLCHITGGGFDDNINRILPNNTCVVYNKFEYSSLFKTLQEIGSFSNKTMKKVFNCGYGMIVVVPCEQYEEIENLLDGCIKIGYVKHITV